MSVEILSEKDGIFKEQMQPLVEIQNLKKYYPIKKGILSKTVGHVKAVDGLDFSIYSGETISLVGESGCGKSTTGRAIVKLDPPTDGKVLFEGRDMAAIQNKELRKIRTDMQIIFQDPYSSLNPRKRIGDLLAEPLIAHRLATKEEASKKVDRMLEIVGLTKFHKSRYPHEFSGGQRQRVGIARALMLNPKLIVCDEPVSALDVSIQAQVLNLLKDLQKEFNLTYLFIAHGLGAVKYISDRIAVMYLGKIVEIGKTEEIFKNPKHPYTQVLLSAYPIPNPHLRNRERIVVEGDVPSPANPPNGCRFHTRCPMAQAMCKEKEPLLDGANHSVACHFPLR
ncbi:ABC transporter ATP-binding protein [Niallia circulans]|jgi:oligopeptide transport system ATP-binding protein|uniref:Peptide ABC transporter substrate-binding protein n=1 Tax=Niallia circulans TaxID=1397 RepID=A0A0J1ILC3_NIACI|nr:dipeptide ABC transporter ATP-binding protein [Niallia circulans]KLV26786.1 peptide ABC transporter substrate-binding protein [Niallia circulans]MDR4317142.1 dipeptide ABC transporter ATP-binding protein [Niallia circulans]MED3838123.1 dipeptide ABC transporter ATP-binding protein [Niallia circulans]MED4241547.1 dipeptide ABC transporter ATP-binding protein [Niallia circulans]MED4247179.1 dipeptide ABC transporter ATP-binding protein [Niallia circulans]